MPRVSLDSNTEHVQNGGRNRGCPRSRIEIGHSVNLPEYAGWIVGKSGLAGNAPILFPAHGVGQFVFPVDLIVESRRNVIPVRVRTLSGCAIQSLVRLAPAEPCGIQPV